MHANAANGSKCGRLRNDNTIPPLNLKPAGNQRQSDNGAGDTDHERD
jgi:hypothetical protein